MGQPNYKQVEELLRERKPFTHAHSMRAEIDGDFYNIFSYSTCIARFQFSTGKWWLNENKYSVTTSKQQNIIRRVAGAAIESLPELPPIYSV